MKCPNCKKEMKNSSKFECRSRIDWDGFNLEHAYMKVFIYTCTDCKIKYNTDEFSGPFSVEDKWVLPKEFQPSEKQIKFAESIASRLDKNIDDLVTKQQFWKFINDNTNTKKYNKKTQEECDRDMECLAKTIVEDYGLDESDLNVYG